ASWLLSLTIVPLFCHHFLKPLKKETFIGRALQWFCGPYKRLLQLALRLRWTVPVLIAGLTMLAAWGFKFIPNIFFPPNERGQFIADFQLPLGRDILETEREAGRLEAWLMEEHGDALRGVSVWIGNGGPRWYLSLAPEKANPNYAFFNILTESGKPEEVRRLMNAVSDHARQAFPDARVSVKALETGPPVGAPIQIRLYGEEMKTLYALKDRIQVEMERVNGVHDVRDDWGAWVKQVTVDPDPVNASRLGLSTKTIASALGAQYQGLTATTYREGDRAIPVIVRSREDFRERPERMRDLPIYGAVGGAVPLSQVADIRTDFQPGSILREDTVRVMTIKAEVRGRYASEALAEIKPSLAALTGDFPPGYRIELGGEQEESAESQGNLAGVMPVSFGMLALILIAQFNSVRRFAIIMLTIPPMLVGITPGLLITGSTFGFMTLLGIIALLGIIVNNAILLIDEVDNQRAAGLRVNEAVIEAAMSRLRPIIMTTATTIIGLMPLSISGGGMWSSMANAMMFGLGFGTVLTLILCPVLLSLFFRDGPEHPRVDAD
ncbi:MAG: efflux RND transporter permease subunit, partial [Pirellulales bacterium]|nr:efflux RND transporter permease subunit [Pirellulales bacterium]